MEIDSYQLKIETIRRNLKHLRNEFGISQIDLADSLGISRQTLSSIEKGSAKPTLKTIHSITEFFGITLDAILNDLTESYCVLTCDIVDSRSALNRNKLQRKIIQFIRILNRNYEHQLLTRFNITLGDEFQGVMKNFNKFFELYLDIRAGMLPYSVSIGVGIGAIETQIYKASSNKMDGPAFHYAREMVEKGKRKQGHFYLKSNRDYDPLVNLLFAEVNHKVEALSNKQIEILHQYVKLNNQIQVAEVMGVSQAYVSNILNQINYQRIKKIMEETEILIKTNFNREKS